MRKLPTIRQPHPSAQRRPRMRTIRKQASVWALACYCACAFIAASWLSFVWLLVALAVVIYPCLMIRDRLYHRWIRIQQGFGFAWNGRDEFLYLFDHVAIWSSTMADSEIIGYGFICGRGPDNWPIVRRKDYPNQQIAPSLLQLMEE